MNKGIRQMSKLFKALASPARLRILMVIGEDEACVCHLEAVLGYRQAYISQQLMALRQAGLLETRRDGRFVFYRLSKPELITIIQGAADLVDAKFDQLTTMSSCCCPSCVAETGDVAIEVQEIDV